MKLYKLFLVLATIICLSACGNKQGAAAEGESADDVAATAETSSDYSDVIKTVYEKFVFAIDADPEIYNHPENYFTPNALRKLKDSYEFDCEAGDCYAFYELRTQEQDSADGSDGESCIVDIEEIGDGWYVVKYLDMGWSGMTRIKLVEDKIDDFRRCVEDL